MTFDLPEPGPVSFGSGPNWTLNKNRFPLASCGEQDLLVEGVPGLSESSLLLAEPGGSSHGRQERHDGTALFIEGHQKRLEHLETTQTPTGKVKTV